MSYVRVCLLALAAALPITAQQAVVVGGDVAKELRLDAPALAAMPRAEAVTVADGVESRYTGVWLHEVLAQAGAPVGEELRGKALASYVVATARDGYQVVFSLAELDPAMREGGALLADTLDGAPLPAAMGPFRLVLPGDKRGARSIRMLERIELVRLRK